MRRINGMRICCYVLILIALSGCSIKFGDFVTNTKFAFPNSNIEPLGTVSAEVTKTGFFNAPLVDKALLDEVMNKALQQKGADLLINYKMQTTVTNFVILPIFQTTLRVEGTACKMTVGRQILK